MYYSNSNVDGGMMKQLNDWYTASIDTALDSKIVKSDFCEQAKVTWYDNTNLTVGNQAMVQVTNDYVVGLKCALDRNGKGPLSMKVGLLTLDEIVMTGYSLYTGTQTNNTNIYLHKNKHWWTMSPAGCDVDNNQIRMWNQSLNGFAANGSVDASNIVRPVFSLSSDLVVAGTGTSIEPYKIILD